MKYLLQITTFTLKILENKISLDKKEVLLLNLNS